MLRKRVKLVKTLISYEQTPEYLDAEVNQLLAQGWQCKIDPHLVKCGPTKYFWQATMIISTIINDTESSRV